MNPGARVSVWPKKPLFDFDSHGIFLIRSCRLPAFRVSSSPILKRAWINFSFFASPGDWTGSGLSWSVIVYSATIRLYETGRWLFEYWTERDCWCMMKFWGPRRASTCSLRFIGGGILVSLTGCLLIALCLKGFGERSSGWRSLCLEPDAYSAFDIYSFMLWSADLLHAGFLDNRCLSLASACRLSLFLRVSLAL